MSPTANVRMSDGTLVPVDFTVPPVTGRRWKPADLPLGHVERLEGANYVRWESLYTSGNTTKDVLSKAAGKYVTLPPGVFQVVDFADINFAGVQMGKSGRPTGGLVGSGAADTFLEIVAKSSTKAGAVVNGFAANNLKSSPSGSTNQTNAWVFQSLNSPLLANLTIRGTEQNHYYNGVKFYNCTGTPRVSGVKFSGASPGFANSPPGETFGVNVYRSPNTTIEECEFDGRASVTGVASASPFGWNSTSGATVRKVYAHDGYAGMTTWWDTVDIYTEDLYVERPATGTGSLSGYGLNHENSRGKILHVRPTILLHAYGPNKTSNNNGLHMSLNSDIVDATDVTLVDPVYDEGPNGVFSVQIEDVYRNGQKQKTPPKVVDAAGKAIPIRVYQ